MPLDGEAGGPGRKGADETVSLVADTVAAQEGVAIDSLARLHRRDAVGRAFDNADGVLAGRERAPGSVPAAADQIREIGRDKGCFEPDDRTPVTQPRLVRFLDNEPRFTFPEPRRFHLPCPLRSTLSSFFTSGE